MGRRIRGCDDWLIVQWDGKFILHPCYLIAFLKLLPPLSTIKLTTLPPPYSRDTHLSQVKTRWLTLCRLMTNVRWLLSTGSIGFWISSKPVQCNHHCWFYSVSISDVSGLSRQLRENSGTGLYKPAPHSSVLACGLRWQVSSYQGWVG